MASLYCCRCGIPNAHDSFDCENPSTSRSECLAFCDTDGCLYHKCSVCGQEDSEHGGATCPQKTRSSLTGAASRPRSGNPFGSGNTSGFGVRSGFGTKVGEKKSEEQKKCRAPECEKIGCVSHKCQICNTSNATHRGVDCPKKIGSTKKAMYCYVCEDATYHETNKCTL